MSLRWCRPLLLAAAMLGPIAAAGARKPTPHAIAIEGARFEPATITVKIGDVVEWKNQDPFPHTATSSTGRFDSKAIAAGASWRYTATRRGEFPYVCALHPTMKATLRVE